MKRIVRPSLVLTLIHLLNIKHMSRQTLIAFAKEQGFNAASEIRENSNGYKYVTLLDSKTGNAENIYLGVRYAGTVATGTKVNPATLFIQDTVNAEGLVRYKISDRSGEVSATKMAAYTTF